MSETETSSLTIQGSLAGRLVRAALVWSLVLLILGAAALTGLFRQTVLSDLDDRLASVAESLIAHVDVEADGVLGLPQQPIDPRYAQAFSGRYWQLGLAPDAGSQLKSESLADEVLSLPEALAAAAASQPGRTVIGRAQGPVDEPLRVHVRAILIDGVETPILFAAAEDRRPADRRVTRFALAAGALFAVFALALAAGVYLQVRVGLEPVLRMGRAVARVRDGDADRIEGAYPSELMPLAGELNSLMTHSREVVDRARTHVGNLAHALKTPITVLSNEARTEDGALAELVRRQTGVMTQQVEHHLRRARAAANAKALGARTPVAEVLDDLGRTLTKIYGRDGIELDWRVEAGLAFRGERQDLEELAGNLMDNACKWASGAVGVVAESSEPGRLRLTVEDDGPGLDADGRSRALERGVRLDEQAPGTGLGLAIVADLAKAYGGALTLDRSERGGLRAGLDLPGVVSPNATERAR